MAPILSHPVSAVTHSRRAFRPVRGDPRSRP